MVQNQLYPVFLKVSQLNILIVGGGNIAHEKLTFLLKSSPNAKVEMVAPMYRDVTTKLAEEYNIKMHLDSYDSNYLKNKHMVIATTDNVAINEQVYHDCRAEHIIVNVADNPPFCDFYMGGIVTKGNVKVAISTNGKSPTTAKRLRQFFEDVIPENIDDLVQNLNKYRETIKGDFEQKVETLNEFTKSLVNKKEDNEN
ncbi:bifunctional precorrin-2 dehydrogenase/sirohydrochlorin ferrochelatase [Kriegella sp. EG-1]|nr:bifunctional precorrin-2 dehydrogenase/sirohydrochlorin ferrochelatase [Flavobacteriaceae bacterium EG-1]